MEGTVIRRRIIGAVIKDQSPARRPQPEVSTVQFTRKRIDIQLLASSGRKRETVDFTRNGKITCDHLADGQRNRGGFREVEREGEVRRGNIRPENR